MDVAGMMQLVKKKKDGVRKSYLDGLRTMGKKTERITRQEGPSDNDLFVRFDRRQDLLFSE
jgi:hypothetical protein